MHRCQHTITICRTVSSVTIADASWRLNSAAPRGISSVVSASRYVHIVHNIIIKSKQEMAINKNIFQLYQKTCSVCQCAITKDCVEGNGKFYHSNCIKVITDYRAECCVTSGSNPLYLQCVDCKMVLDGCYYVFMGNFFCEKDYNVSCQLQSVCCP